MLTCGSREVNLAEIEAVPIPESTKSWKPISHIDLINEAKKAAINVGLVLGNESYGLQSDNNKMFGIINVINQDHFGDRVQLMMGLRNSTDKSLSAGVCFGSRVLVCDNLCFTAYTHETNGESFITTRKHTVNIERDLPLRLNEAMARFQYIKDYQENLFNKLSNTDINSTTQIHDILIKSILYGAINKTQVLDVLNEWNTQAHIPENEEQAMNWHPEFQDRNAWSLYNAYTENAKTYQSRNPLKASDRAIRLTGFFNKEFNF